MNKYAPIALFTFKRPSHTQRALHALSMNPEFMNSPLFIFCDGPRHEGETDAVRATRKVIFDWPHPEKTVIESDENRGLARSVIQGVDLLCRDFGRAIIVEDDLVVAPGFLKFLNSGLERYASDQRVMQISGYMFPISPSNGDIGDAIFLPFTTSWGWATWNRAWAAFNPRPNNIDSVFSKIQRRRDFDLHGSYPYFEMLRQQSSGKIDSWAIRWYLSVFLAGGLVLYPRRTLVRNDGFDGTGTHCGEENISGLEELVAVDLSFEAIQNSVDSVAFKLVQKHLRTNRGLFKLIFDELKRVFL